MVGVRLATLGAVAAILCSPASAQEEQVESVYVRRLVAQSGDDTENIAGEETIDPSGAVLHLGANAGAATVVGLHFRELGVPAGAQVTSATLRFVPSDDASELAETPELLVFATPQAGAPTRDAQLGALKRVQQEGIVDLGDLSAVVQEVLEDAGLEGMNSLYFRLQGSSQSGTTLPVFSFDHGVEGSAPMLLLRYTVPNQDTGGISNETLAGGAAAGSLLAAAALLCGFCSRREKINSLPNSVYQKSSDGSQLVVSKGGFEEFPGETVGSDEGSGVGSGKKSSFADLEAQEVNLEQSTEVSQEEDSGYREDERSLSGDEGYDGYDGYEGEEFGGDYTDDEDYYSDEEEYDIDPENPFFKIPERPASAEIMVPMSEPRYEVLPDETVDVFPEPLGVDSDFEASDIEFSDFSDPEDPNKPTKPAPPVLSDEEAEEKRRRRKKRHEKKKREEEKRRRKKKQEAKEGGSTSTEGDKPKRRRRKRREGEKSSKELTPEEAAKREERRKRRKERYLKAKAEGRDLSEFKRSRSRSRHRDKSKSRSHSKSRSKSSRHASRSTGEGKDKEKKRKASSEGKPSSVEPKELPAETA